MIAIANNDETFDVEEYNVYNKETESEFWIKSKSGNKKKLATGTKEEMQTIKKAVDFAVETGEWLFKL